ncbi:Spo0E family sporulation regulatory protein-aspartic acid phosphatase [Clostridium gasigenes]|uniref:Spo0E like sporulation regulatory protein n=1 Tax=Clostridium gasigenes TaxID=94869 RepID=A0A1H0M5Q5_9CLOT|nr:Spo0E family sporulation regulatory protein-aspartic acid phosphatase [Clostridium gasigenes]SDO75769.1 Spo0E like sporulation regulatory protein [Clostridium gasigenes]
MKELMKELNSRVTLNNLCNPEILELSRRLDKKVVEEQMKIVKEVNKIWG